MNSDERITTAEWFRWVMSQDSVIALLLNADIYLDEWLENLAASFNMPEAFISRLPATTLATPIFISTTTRNGRRTCGVRVPMRSYRRAFSMRAAFR